MIVFRRRLLFWLIRAYLKKWGKIIVFSFISGLVIFFLATIILQNFSHILPLRNERIGLYGAYTVDTLPSFILADLSRGLTKIEANGKISPDVSSSWEVADNGKTFVFHLKEDLVFVDGREITSKEIKYEFADVTTDRPDDKTIVYKLKDGYSPFLVTASRPIFRDGLKGISTNKITELKLNGNFVSSLSFTEEAGKKKSVSYIFYPNQDALKTAFLLGEVTKVIGINDLFYEQTSLADYKNTTLEKEVNYTQLVTLFFDTKDGILSDSKLRRGLSYALPNEFQEGQRSYLPYPPTLYYGNKDLEKHVQDLSHAKVLIDASLESASASGRPTITLKTLQKYEVVARRVADVWKKVGVEVKIENVETVPDTFQAYLGDFTVPKDPDQYMLWHSSQIGSNNITKFDNKRIDKLLEDGRKIFDTVERKKTYDDFQKYLLDESPATFLYFPYSYTVTRK